MVLTVTCSCYPFQLPFRKLTVYAHIFQISFDGRILDIQHVMLITFACSFFPFIISLFSKVLGQVGPHKPLIILLIDEQSDQCLHRLSLRL